jgi:AcrR family transcriptional regulator
MINFEGLSIAALPAPLAAALGVAAPGLPKRERTRRLLLLAAVQVFSARGVAASTIQEIAEQAGMTTGTVYNHFETREAIVEALALWLADTLCRRIADSQSGITDGAQRMAIGSRRYIWLAQQSPAWALLLLDIAASAPALMGNVASYSLADLRMGLAQKTFKVVSEAAAMDLIMGTGVQAMRSVALGLAPADHDIASATTVLRGLGVGFDKAAEIASRPLPDFSPLPPA